VFTLICHSPKDPHKKGEKGKIEVQKTEKNRENKEKRTGKKHTLCPSSACQDLK
jgi:hypothetical protein